MMALAGAAITAATPALATNHGFCAIGNMCIDNGTNTPTPVNPPTFGFSASPGPASGDVLIAILIPNNDPAGGPYTMSGYWNATATQHSGVWTSGQLDSFLGISASPTNPIGAYLPSTQGLDAGATGFFVFTADVGQTTLPSNSGANDSFLSTLGQGVPIGSYIVAFLNTGDGINATANSGAIFEDGRPVPEPATWAMMLLGFGGIGMALRRKGRRGNALMQVA